MYFKCILRKSTYLGLDVPSITCVKLIEHNKPLMNASRTKPTFTVVINAPEEAREVRGLSQFTNANMLFNGNTSFPIAARCGMFMSCKGND